MAKKFPICMENIYENVEWKVCKYKKIGRKEKKIDPISLGYQPEYFYFFFV